MKQFFCAFCFLFIHCFLTAQDCIIHKIEFSGVEKTNPLFLKSLIKTKEGRVFNEQVVNQDITRLVRLPSVAKATYSIDKVEVNCALIIHIVENTTIIPFINLFETSNREIAFLLGLYEHDLLKRAISFGGWYQKNIFDSYGVGLRAPYLFSPKTGISLTIQNLTTQEPVFFQEGTAIYKYSNRSAELLGLYQFDFNNRMSLGVNYFKEIYDGLEVENIPSAPLEFSINKLLIKGVYTYDNLCYDYHNVSGFKSELNIQYVESVDKKVDSEFFIAWNDFLYFKRFGAKGNLAHRLRLGLSTNEESPFAPFALDNNLNIRGVGNIIDRGTGVILLNSEYRHTLLENGWGAIQSNIFVDAGTWRNPGGDFNNFTDHNNVRVFVGGGARFIHKKIFNLILRIDFGYGLTKDEPYGIVFGIGQYF